MSNTLNDDSEEHDADDRNTYASFSRMINQGRSFSGRERNCCYLNTGGFSAAEGRFANVSATTGIDFPDDGRALAVVDWDHDGDLDLWVSNRNAPRLRFLRNDARHVGNFVMIRLVGNGTTTNRDAIGARVELVLGDDGVESLSNETTDDADKKLIRTLVAGEGFLSQNSKWIHFGIGGNKHIEKVIVYWPAGGQEEFRDVVANGHYILAQGSGQPKPAPGGQRKLELTSSEQTAPANSKSALRLATPVDVTALPYETYSGEKRLLTTGDSGQPLLVNLWGSWCLPCRAELKDFVSAQKTFRSVGLRVVVLSIDGLDNDPATSKQAEDWLQAIEFPFESGLATASLLDSLQKIHNRQTPYHRPLPIPTSFLIDADGELLTIYSGPVSADEIIGDLNVSRDTSAERFKWAAAFPGRVVQHKVARMARGKAEAEIRFNSAKILQRSGHWERAARQYRAILSILPDSDRVHSEIAHVLMQQELLEPARKHLEEALRIDPNSSVAHLRLGNLLMRRHQYALAATHFDQALQLKPDDTTTLINRGHLHSALSQYKLALDDFERALELNPDDAGTQNNLAWLLATCPDSSFRDGQRSIALAQRACGLLKWDDSGALDTLAAACAEMGQFSEAIKWQNKAIELVPVKSRSDLLRRLESYKSGLPYRVQPPN